MDERDPAKVLAELLRGGLAKSSELAAKQRRLLEHLQQPDELEQAHQQAMADAVAAWHARLPRS